MRLGSSTDEWGFSTLILLAGEVEVGHWGRSSQLEREFVSEGTDYILYACGRWLGLIPSA